MEEESTHVFVIEFQMKSSWKQTVTECQIHIFITLFFKLKDYNN